MFQHYVLYPAKKSPVTPKASKDAEEPLVKSTDESQSEEVWS